MVYQLSQIQTERFRHDGSALILALGEKLFRLNGGHVTDFYWEEPKDKGRMMDDLKGLEDQVRNFTEHLLCVSVFSHPLISRYRAKPGMNQMVTRVVSCLAYLNLFHNISPDVINLAKTVTPEATSIADILETRRVVGLLILHEVVVINQGETENPFLPACRLNGKLLSVILGGDKCLSVLEPGLMEVTRRDEAARAQAKKPDIMSKARYGVLVYDEVSKKKARQSSGYDISSNSVQAEFLRLMEGSSITLGTHYVDRTTRPGEFNSNGTMFIFAGLLQDFDQVINGLAKKKAGIGFHGEAGLKHGSYLYDAMVEYGFIPEFINRLTALVPFQPLTIPALCKITLEVVDDYNQLFADDGLKISLSSRAVQDIAEYCSGDLQARGLCSRKTLAHTLFNRGE